MSASQIFEMENAGYMGGVILQFLLFMLAVALVAWAVDEWRKRK